MLLYGISVCVLQNESKLHHVFLLVCNTSWLPQSQSRKANKSGWKLVVISQTDISDEKFTRQMLRREQFSCQMLGKCVWDVSNDSHMNGRAHRLILTTNSILGFVCCFADWSGIVSFVKAWPSEVRSFAVNLGQEKSRRLETRGRRGKATRERANGGKAERSAGIPLWLHICGEGGQTFFQPVSEAADFYPRSLRCCFFLICKKKEKRNSAVNVLFGDWRLCFLIQKHDARWISPFQLCTLI